MQIILIISLTSSLNEWRKHVQCECLIGIIIAFFIEAIDFELVVDYAGVGWWSCPELVPNLPCHPCIYRVKKCYSFPVSRVRLGDVKVTVHSRALMRNSQERTLTWRLWIQTTSLCGVIPVFPTVIAVEHQVSKVRSGGHGQGHVTSRRNFLNSEGYDLTLICRCVSSGVGTLPSLTTVIRVDGVGAWSTTSTGIGACTQDTKRKKTMISTLRLSDAIWQFPLKQQILMHPSSL